MRETARAIDEKRRNRGSTILVTGGTGLIGAHVAVRLLRSGYRVLLIARRNRQLTARERVDRLLDWFGLEGPFRPRLEVFEGLLDKPDLGLNASEYTSLAGGVDEIVHCASDTSFAERRRAEIERANVESLENLLRLASRGRCSFFHQISTAYVAGGEGVPCKEELVEARTFANVYEETKWRAEWIAARRCAELGVRLNIYRPSIVYGDAVSGRTIRFNGLYYPIKVILYFKELYEKDLREHGGGKAAEMGVRIDQDNAIHLPIRVKAGASGGINLIPINHFVDAFTAIRDECLEGNIFHIVNRRSEPAEDIIDYVKRFFGISGITAVPEETFGGPPRNGLEILFDHYVRAYGPYIRDSRIFDDSRAAAILGRRKTEYPQFDYDIFARCMHYAVQADWGARLFTATD